MGPVFINFLYCYNLREKNTSTTILRLILWMQSFKKGRPKIQITNNEYWADLCVWLDPSACRLLLRLRLDRRFISMLYTAERLFLYFFLI